jgi:1-acyl-sn-glycerol-3-phosphate acyltransferase
VSDAEPEDELFDEAMDLARELPFLAGGGWRKLLRDFLDCALGLTETREGYKRAAVGEGNVFDRVCHVFGLIPCGTWPVWPAGKPLLIVANHPFGGAEAMVLGSLCLRARQEGLMMANQVVAKLPFIGEFLLPLSILGESEAARKNGASLKRAFALLRSGGALAAFPSGEVASWRGDRVEEGQWSHHIAALALKTGATVVPVRFFGQSPPWFHLLGGIHPRLRTALLPRVMLASRGRNVVFRVGAGIDSTEHLGKSPDVFAAFLRKQTLGIVLD